MDKGWGTEMIRWEYKQEFAPSFAKIAQMGQLGWELVTVKKGYQNGVLGWVHFLKRPIEDKTDK
jgi:hypothetical protein